MNDEKEMKPRKAIKWLYTMTHFPGTLHAFFNKKSLCGKVDKPKKQYAAAWVKTNNCKQCIKLNKPQEEPKP